MQQLICNEQITGINSSLIWPTTAECWHWSNYIA